jgi:hypothetical protein
MGITDDKDDIQPVHETTFDLTKRALPRELIDLVASYLERNELPTFLRATRVTHDVGVKYLYKTIADTDTPAPQMVRCLQSLVRHRTACAHVHLLGLVFVHNRPTGNLITLITRVLHRLTNLRSLILDLPQARGVSPTGILNNSYIPFKLRHFATCLRADASLATFLVSQPLIEDLELTSLYSPLCSAPDAFVLPSTALPHLRIVHITRSVDVTRAVVSGRAIEKAFVAPFDADVTESLNAVATGSTSLRRLSITAPSTESIGKLLEQISRNMPMLEALHVIDIMPQVEVGNLSRSRLSPLMRCFHLLRCQSVKSPERSVADMLNDAAPIIGEFKHLRYFTYMATGTDLDLKEETKITEDWSSMCPSLRTIILPAGRVWFAKDDKWQCLI